MMLSIAKTTPNLWVFSPPSQNQRENRTISQNGFIFFKPFSTTPTPSSNSCESCHTLKASRLLTETTHHKISDKDSQIRRFCKLGNLKNAVDLLFQSQSSELELRAYCSVWQLCADLKSLEYGKKVHMLLGTNGVAIEGALGSKLVFMYVKCGDLREGRRVFDEIGCENVFLWNLLIGEYAKIHNFRESIFLYRRMRELGIETDSYTFSCVLKCYAAMRSRIEGESVHSHLLKLGFGSYSAVGNSLIAFYFKCGRVESARKVFVVMSDRDVISWNSMISGCVSNGLAELGLHSFMQMLCSGVEFDLATMVSVLAACANTGALLLVKELHAYSIKSCFNVEVTLNNTLLDTYSKCGDLDSAVRVFERMGKRCVVTWTSMIAGCAREGLSDRAIRLFHKMENEGLQPDVFTITSVLHACACNGSLENGKHVHDYIMKNNMQLSLSVSNALMDMYAKCGSINDAYSIFSEMPMRDIISWNTMIGGYSKNSLPNEALHLFVEMQKGSKIDSRTIACALPACSSLAALERGRELHAQILRKGFSSDRHVNNALVDMYVKCGVLGLARSLFDTILSRDLVSWTVMVAGYGMHGLGGEAIATFNEMRTAGIEPDEVSFISILYACSHSGLRHEGWKLFSIMKNECNINPKLEHYACMVDLLARTGELMEAYRFITRMPLEADATIWGALLCGCRIHHDVILAEKVADRVFKLEPENTGYYVLLANIYAEAEKWEEVKKLREKIGRHGLRKNPGCSWIEIRGKVYIFVAGGGSHPQVKVIEPFLKRLTAKMKEQGYTPNTKYALINAGEMEKEAALCGHSEKFAMAFGILSLAPGKTIRVAKNLRVCGDCHETAKFMSKTVGREIVLRDSNRFHHFKDGHCSCRGYW